MGSGVPLSASPEDPSAAFAELSTLAVSATPLQEILQRTVELTRGVLAAEVEASITLINGDEVTTPAATAAWAITLDHAQYEHGHGPCLDSARGGQLVLVHDIAGDQRWPPFADAARKAGAGSSLSAPLPAQRHVIGALNVYSRKTGAFDDERVGLAEQFASYAAVAIGNTALYLSSAALAAQMEEAMASRAVIEQAKGIVMATNRCGPDAAFAALVAASQQTHQKLRDIARDLVERTGR
jgi:GAF domain-containing protein